MKDDGNWHLDKKVPIGILFAMFAQTLVFVYFFSSFIADTNQRLTSLEKFEATISVSRPVTQQRLTILEQQYIFIQNSLMRIEGNQNKNLDKILQEVNPKVQGNK